MSKLQIYVCFRPQDTGEHAWLKVQAHRQGRSMAQEILALIRRARASEESALQDLARTEAYQDHEQPAQDPA